MVAKAALLDEGGRVGYSVATVKRGDASYFGPEERPLFGWLHRASAPSPLGLVVCNPFGFEAICAHRSLRELAAAAAEAGVPAIRFDYDGTGDSAGDDRDPARLEAWVASVGHAIAELRRQTGVAEVVLAGVRLGALVATLAAVERDDVAGIVAIAPVVAGKTHLRELRALQMTLGLAAPPAGATALPSDEQEVIGFRITAETKAALSKIDLAKLERPPAPALLLLDRDDLPGNDAWPTQLAAQGVRVEARRLPGYVEMMLPPDQAVVPTEMIRASVEWLRARVRPGAHAGAAAPILPRAEAAVAPGVVERAVVVGGERRLFGILAEPATPPSRRRALLLLSAGAMHRIGPNRLYVGLARRWAALGHAVLRLDVSGIGDSQPAPGAPENVVYTDVANDDVKQAVAFLRQQTGISEVHALGLCSGGYNAFKAAVADAQLDGVVLINPLVFFFKADRPEEKQAHEASLGRLSRRALDLEVWKKLLRGELHLAQTGKVAVRRASMLARDRLRGLMRTVGVRIEDDLAAELEALAARDVALRFVFAEGDPGQALLRAQAGPALHRLQSAGRLRVDVIAGPDHNFTPMWSHAPLTEALAAFFDGPPRRP